VSQGGQQGLRSSPLEYILKTRDTRTELFILLVGRKFGKIDAKTGVRVACSCTNAIWIRKCYWKGIFWEESPVGACLAFGRWPRCCAILGQKRFHEHP
jgi:hypothetical protein